MSEDFDIAETASDICDWCGLCLVDCTCFDDQEEE